MHISKLKKYYFINEFNFSKLIKLDRDISLIWRSKHIEKDKISIIQAAKFCKKYKRKFFVSNDFKLAVKLNINGVYISAYNKNLRHNNYKFKSNFKIIGSAHNYCEIVIKKMQNVEEIFMSPIFKYKSRSALGLHKTKLIFDLFKGQKIALGGINKNNLKLLNLNKYTGFAGIDYFS